MITSQLKEIESLSVKEMGTRIAKVIIMLSMIVVLVVACVLGALP